MSSHEQPPPEHLYIHVPFCTGKCAYCGFYSEPLDPVAADRFIEVLARELSAVSARFADGLSPSTLYIGGGTPSLLTPAQWGRLGNALRETFNLARIAEVSVEANPGTVSRATIDAWQAMGVTRVSLGAQSMRDSTLARIGRRHNAAQTARTVRLLQRHGLPDIGLDLMACLPGVSHEEWRETLRHATDLAPSHMSVYALGIEPGTALETLCRQGLLRPAGTEDEIRALDEAAAHLAGAGFEHYEISNFARPGHRCRYNLAVWKGADYIGFGPAAASRVGLERRMNAPDLAAYLALRPDDPPRADVQVLAPETDAAERLMFSFRLPDPVLLDDVARRLGPAARDLLPFWREQLAALAGAGLVECVNGAWRRTEAGLHKADSIAEALLP